MAMAKAHEGSFGEFMAKKVTEFSNEVSCSTLNAAHAIFITTFITCDNSCSSLMCAHQDAVLKELHTLINTKPDLLMYKYFIKIFRLTDSINEDAPYRSIGKVYKQAKSVKVASFKDHSLFINSKENLRKCVL